MSSIQTGVSEGNHNILQVFGILKYLLIYYFVPRNDKLNITNDYINLIICNKTINNQMMQANKDVGTYTFLGVSTLRESSRQLIQNIMYNYCTDKNISLYLVIKYAINIKRLNIRWCTGLTLDDILCLPHTLNTLRLPNDFNEPLCTNLFYDSLTKLKFSDYFNKQIKTGDLPHSIIELKLGSTFNQRIDFLHSLTNLEKLTFGMDFNHSIEKHVLPDRLLYIKFGNVFNQILTSKSLPSKLKSLILNSTHQYSLNNVSSILDELIFYNDEYWCVDYHDSHHYSKQPLNSKMLRTVKFLAIYDDNYTLSLHTMINLDSHLEELHLSCFYPIKLLMKIDDKLKKVRFLPLTLKKIVFRATFDDKNNHRSRHIKQRYYKFTIIELKKYNRLNIIKNNISQLDFGQAHYPKKWIFFDYNDHFIWQITD